MPADSCRYIVDVAAVLFPIQLLGVVDEARLCARVSLMVFVLMVDARGAVLLKAPERYI